jgi:hypothetical protein
VSFTKIADSARKAAVLPSVPPKCAPTRKRTAALRAIRLAKEAADRDKPAEPKAKAKRKKKAV